MPTVAVLGTGIMGGPIARNLAGAGLSVRAWNRTRDRARPLAEHGVEVAGSPAEAARGADIVVTMLADGDAVEATAAEGGVLDAMDANAVWAQMSTVGIEATERLSALARERGIAFVDAPVLGTRQPAEQGALVVIAAGPEDAIERCRALFEAVGSKTVVLDRAGQATRLKLAVNTWLVGIVESLAETVALARALDLDPARFLEAIEGTAVDCGYAHAKGALMIEESFEPPAFPLRLADKDARLVLEAAATAGLELPLAEAVRRQFARAVDAGHGDEDMAAVYRAVRAEAHKT